MTSVQLRAGVRGRGLRRGASAIAVVLAASAVMLAAETKGKVRKGVYYSPETNFSVPVPSAGRMRVSDGHNAKEGIGAVSFYDDFGNQRGIHYMRIPVDLVAQFDQAGQPADLLAHWLSNFALPYWFRPASANSRILHEASLSFEGDEALLAEVEIPGGSPLVVMDQQGTRRLDSRRRLVVFRRGSYLYIVTMERGKSLFGSREEPDKPPEAPEGDWTAFASEIVPFYRSIAFTP